MVGADLSAAWDKPAAVRPSSAFTTVDLDGAGKQVGFLMIPHSPNDDAWGVTRIPLAVIANGSGPTVVLEAGNHGDEYEGPDRDRRADPRARSRRASRAGSS